MRAAVQTRSCATAIVAIALAGCARFDGPKTAVDQVSEPRAKMVEDAPLANATAVGVARAVAESKAAAAKDAEGKASAAADGANKKSLDARANAARADAQAAKDALDAAETTLAEDNAKVAAHRSATDARKAAQFANQSRAFAEAAKASAAEVAPQLVSGTADEKKEAKEAADAALAREADAEKWQAAAARARDQAEADAKALLQVRIAAAAASKKAEISAKAARGAEDEKKSVDARLEYEAAHAKAERSNSPADKAADAASLQNSQTAATNAEKSKSEAQAAAQTTNQTSITGPAAPPAPTPDQQTQVEFRTGDRLRYGLSASLFEFSVERPNNEPGRLRRYAPTFDVVPAEIGFQFTLQPSGSPWRLQKADTSTFQLMSCGGMLLVRIDNKNLAQGAVAVGATLNFFENVLGIGVGVDLYRGVPIQGANGAASGSTAYTGLLAWAFAPQGEMTPEDVFVVLTFGLDPIVKALSGELKQ